MPHSLANWLGVHAPSAFLALLSLTLVLVAIGWWVIHRVEQGRGGDPLPPGRALFVRLVVGFVIVFGAGHLFVEMTEALDVREEMGQFDSAFADALRQHLSQRTLSAFALLTRLGDVATLTVLCIVVAAVLVWRGKRALALLWVVAVSGGGLLNTLLKITFERARPIHQHGLVTADGWSFPSGHSSGALVSYGMLAYVVIPFVPPRWRLPVLLLAVTVALTTGVSRLFLQVHYASDVVAGFASGLLWLAACVLSGEWARTRYDRRRAQ